MANVNNPHGLMPTGRNVHGGNVDVEQFNKPVGGGTAIFCYDVVYRAAGALTPGGSPGSTVFTGVALNYGAALKATDHLVVVSPGAVYDAQDDGSSGSNAPTTAALIGYNANLVFTAGSTTLFVSKHSIAASTIDTTATLDVKLLQLLGSPDNAYGNYSRIEVMINRHVLANQVAGA